MQTEDRTGLELGWARLKTISNSNW